VKPEGEGAARVISCSDVRAHNGTTGTQPGGSKSRLRVQLLTEPISQGAGSRDECGGSRRAEAHLENMKAAARLHVEAACSRARTTGER